jgi:hypothetical protein
MENFATIDIRIIALYFFAKQMNALLSIHFLLVAQVTIFLLSMQALIHAWASFFCALPIFIAECARGFHYLEEKSS